MKRWISTLICATLLFSMAGCTTPTPPQSSQLEQMEQTVTFTDDLGRTVTLCRPKRVAALIGSFADIWCLAGGKETLVAAADDTWTQFDLGLSEDVKHLGAVKTPNVETLLATEPDFVIGSTKTAANVELMELCDQLNIPAACFDVSSFEDYLRMLEICTHITGQQDAYTQYGSDIKAQVDQAKARADGRQPTVLYIRATGSSCKVKNSQNTVLGEMLAEMDCINIADSQTALLESLSMETILATDPDYIFVVLQGSDPTDAQKMLEGTLLSNPAWASLRAVQEDRFYLMNQQLYNLKPNARWGEAYEGLADILYPQR